MTLNALGEAISRKSLSAIWAHERSRLIRSCFGIDRQTGGQFDQRKDYEFYCIRERALGKLNPRGLLAIAKPKPEGGNRIVCVPTISDRVIQLAVLSEIRPDLPKMGLLNPISYGLVRAEKRGAADARRKAVTYRLSRPWVYKTDIQKFFDTIPRQDLRREVRIAIRKPSLLPVVLPFLDCEIEDGFDPDWKEVVAKAGIKRGEGVRQGMPLSSYFAGIYLRDVDKRLAKLNCPVIRYVDDLVGFFETGQQCVAFHERLRKILLAKGLMIGEPNSSGSKTKIYAPDQLALFLGMELKPKPGGGYSLFIPASCIEKVGVKFTAASDVASLLKRGTDFFSFGGYLRSLRHGYLHAYEGAGNHSELNHEVSKMAQDAFQNVLNELFGPQLTELTPTQRRFLCLDTAV